jgi:hypothetical protein
MSRSKYNSERKNRIATAQGKTAGYIRGDVFYRKFDPDRHILRKPTPSLAIDTQVLETIAQAGVTRLNFYTQAGECYSCSLAHFQQAARPVDFGYGAQLALPLTGFSVTKSGAALQLPLFGGVS